MPLDLHFKLFDFLIVMAVELGIGLLIGLIKNVLAKQQAISNPERYQVFQCNDYESVGYGARTPDDSDNAFGVDYSFVIVEFQAGEVIRERFFSPLGDSIKVEYIDGELTAKTSCWSVPIYSMTVVIPLVVGFLGVLGITELDDDSFENAYEIASNIGNYAIYLMASGALWTTVLNVIPSMIAMHEIVNRDVTNFSERQLSLPIQAKITVSAQKERELMWFERYFWVFLIVVTIFNGLTLYFQGWHDMATLELKLSYAKLTLYVLLWANVPWLVIGIGCLQRNLTLKDYLEPQTLHPALMAFFASLISVFVMGSYWIFAAGGAEQLLHYPGIDAQSWTVEQVKQVWSFGVISGIGTMAVMVARADRTSVD